MQIARLLKHVTATHWRTRLLFPPATLDAIEAAITRTERAHGGEIRFAIETALTPTHILQRVTPQQRAREVFAHLRVWDTEANNGVLIYVQLADRHVEIITDRGLQGRVTQPEWEAVCRLIEEHYRAGRFQSGSVAGVEAVGNLIARHFPAPGARGQQAHNQLPDRPALL
jgi:uncharacterized membrane protein